MQDPCPDFKAHMTLALDPSPEPSLLRVRRFSDGCDGEKLCETSEDPQQDRGLKKTPTYSWIPRISRDHPQRPPVLPITMKPLPPPPSSDRPDSPTYVPEERERRVIRKVDLRIIPLSMMLYFFSFLDRVNIGSAKLYGMKEELGLEGYQYQTAVSILFVTYVLFELPSNLVLKKVTPRIWLSFLVFGWGISAIGVGLTRSYTGLLIFRLLIGAFEAGVFPGLAVLLTMFYTRDRLALRIGYLFVSSATSGSFGGILAWAIHGMDGVGGYSAWRWIFVIEGIPNLFLSVAVFLFLPNSIEVVEWLNEEEKQDMRKLRAREFGVSDEFEVRDVKRALTDWKVWIFGVAQFGVNSILYGYSTFLPTIIAGLGENKWSNELVQLLTVPCYFAGICAYMCIASISDRTQKRAPFCIAFGLITVVGYAILLTSAPMGVRYFGFVSRPRQDLSTTTHLLTTLG
ncbi:hypothetical protein OQA88_9874 [Cercophora sp. LCS_1]